MNLVVRAEPDHGLVGRGRTMTHDYKRNGTVDLFAAMNLAAKPALTFFKPIDLHVPRHLDEHVVLKDLSVHKSEPVRTWLADPKRARWHLHFTPTPSWLNLLEGCFSVLTHKASTNTSFTSTRRLGQAIDGWASHWNDDPQPFVWTKTVDDINTKVKCRRATLDRISESATHH